MSGYRASWARPRWRWCTPRSRAPQRSCTSPSRGSSWASGCAALRAPRSTCPTGSPATSQHILERSHVGCRDPVRGHSAIGSASRAERCAAREGLRPFRRRRLRAALHRRARAAARGRSACRASSACALTRIGIIQSGQPRLTVVDAQGRPMSFRGGFDHFGPAMIVLRPTPAFAYSHPAHVVAFGFGAGLARVGARHLWHARGVAVGLGAGRRASGRGFRGDRVAVSFSAYGHAASPDGIWACTITAPWCGTNSSLSCSS